MTTRKSQLPTNQPCAIRPGGLLLLNALNARSPDTPVGSGVPLSTLHARGPFTLHDLIQGLRLHMTVIGPPISYSVRRFGK